MRIIAGTHGGRRIDAPRGDAVRPTSDRVREALFSILGQPAPSTHVLDAFAGAGSLGLEALSRGAASATFIDNARASLSCVRRNIQILGLEACARVISGDALTVIQRMCASGPGPAFRWVFLDPPYRGDLAARALHTLGSPEARGRLLTPDALIVVEHDRRNPPAKTCGSLVRNDPRRYGDTEISIYHYAETSRPTPDLEPAA